MRIDRIELYHVAMPLISPWRTAYGEDSEIHSVLCRMVSGDAWGWGESSPLAAPCYSPEWAGGVFHTTRQWLAPALCGSEIDSGQQLARKLQVFKGNRFARGLLDSAWWSLQSQISGQPLHELLGATRDIVHVGADFGVMDSRDQLTEAVGQAHADGFARVKLSFRPGWDLPIVRHIREQFPDLPLHIDCNSGYRLADLNTFQQLDALGLTMFEQPLAHDDFWEHAQLQAQLETPICLDESIGCLRHVETALAQQSCRYVNVKPGRVGGITEARAVHDLCRSRQIPCWVGGMLESAVGAAQCVALAMLDNFTYPADIFPSSRFYREDLADPPIELQSLEGRPAVAAVKQLPQPLPARLKRCTLQQATVS